MKPNLGNFRKNAASLFLLTLSALALFPSYSRADCQLNSYLDSFLENRETLAKFERRGWQVQAHSLLYSEFQNQIAEESDSPRALHLKRCKSNVRAKLGPQIESKVNNFKVSKELRAMLEEAKKNSDKFDEANEAAYLIEEYEDSQSKNLFAHLQACEWEEYSIFIQNRFKSGQPAFFLSAQKLPGKKDTYQIILRGPTQNCAADKKSCISLLYSHSFKVTKKSRQKILNSMNLPADIAPLGDALIQGEFFPSLELERLLGISSGGFPRCRN